MDTPTQQSSESKDVIYFTSPQDDDNIVEDKQKAPLPPDLGEAVGPSGEIDWDCPCLQGMTDGPCGEVFKQAFSCFVYSQEEEKGSDCLEQFRAMHECLNQHEDYYSQGSQENDREDASTELEDIEQHAETSNDGTDASNEMLSEAETDIDRKEVVDK